MARSKRRKGGLVELSQALQQFMTSHGIEERLRHLELHPVWEEVVGPELAKLTSIRSFRQNILRIWVASAPVLSELSTYRKPGLLRALNERLDGTRVTDIKFYLK